MLLDTDLNISRPGSVDTAEGIMSDAVYQVLLSAIIPTGLVIAAFGIAGNIANIMVYFKMGFAESVNVSLIALACADLGGVLTACITQIFFLPIFEKVPILPGLFVFTVSSYPHVVLTRLSGLIIAFISLERYLCVFMPLKIKDILVPKRTLAVMAAIFAAVVPPIAVIYFRYPLGWMFFPEQNRSLFTIVPVQDSVIESAFMIFQLYSSTVLPIASFLVVTLCTILLSVSLVRSKRWRDSNKQGQLEADVVGDKKKTKSSTKEVKVIKMVVAIATVFIVSTIPSCIHIIIVMLFPEFDINGRYSNVFNIAGHSFFVIDLINSSANIIIYYNMSTKFRQTAHELFSFKLLSRRLAQNK